MKGGKIVKKNRIIKGILLLIVLAVLSMGFTGCGALLTGTVYVYVSAGGWAHDIYMDYVQQFNNIYTGTYVLYNVPIGNHFFEAIDDWGWSYGYDSVTQYIHAGNNYVYLYP